MSDELPCGVCKGESGGKFVGVACVPSVPLSIAWCSNCIQRDAAPDYVFEHDFIFVANGDVNNLCEWARTRVTWVDGKYISFDEYVRRITPERVAQAQKDWMERIRENQDDESGTADAPAAD
jgi:reverse gyrase